MNAVERSATPGERPGLGPRGGPRMVPPQPEARLGSIWSSRTRLPAVRRSQGSGRGRDTSPAAPANAANSGAAARRGTEPPALNSPDRSPKPALRAPDFSMNCQRLVASSPSSSLCSRLPAIVGGRDARASTWIASEMAEPDHSPVQAVV